MKPLFKFDKLFEYYKYLENINDISDEEIKNMSNIFNNYTISEGLIKTYPLQSSINIIKRRFPLYNVSVSENDEIVVEDKNLDKEKIKVLSNTLGYIISNEADDYVIIEPKYDRVIDNVPKIIYHSTFKKHLKKIKKNGLIPKSKNKLSIHPDRIYFSLNLEDAELFKKFLEKKYEEKSCIIEINTEGLSNKFYSDINFRNRGIYTLNNISKNNIKD